MPIHCFAIWSKFDSSHVMLQLIYRVALQNNSTSAFLEAIRSHVNPQLQMVVCILPTNKKDLYDAIKKQCCVESPVPSQCITNKLISNPKGIMSPVSKIAIQLNCKLGGEAWSVEIPVSTYISY